MFSARLSRATEALAGLAPARPQDAPAEVFLRSLFYFNLYRLVVAGVFVAVALLFGASLSFGSEQPQLFIWVASIYLLVASLFFGTLDWVRRRFNLYLSVQVATDILALTLLMHASGGAKSGLAFMMLVVLAGAGLVGEGRLTLFYAALAALAVLFEQAYRILAIGGDQGDFLQAGITSVGFFATAITARLLARRVVANAALAQSRGLALADQLRINQRVIRDMQDGVLVVDAEARVRQHNPQAETLLGLRVAGSSLASLATELDVFYRRWRTQTVEAAESFRAPASGRMLRARFLPAGEGGNALIYLEDMEKAQAQAQQMKLAALGRLTANIAHEIRNPLAAVSHAAELLADEHRGEMMTRLIGIIGDNSQRINRLVSEVLELGRRDRAQPEPLLLAEVIARFIDEYGEREPRVRQAVAVSVEPQDLRLYFDRAHFDRVLWNLVANALRHASGGSASVRIEGRAAWGGRADLHLIDDGPGVSPELRVQVFEPFFTTAPSGTGLGLYIARELCEANGAVLEILDNAPGAHFCIRGAICP